MKKLLFLFLILPSLISAQDRASIGFNYDAEHYGAWQIDREKLDLLLPIKDFSIDLYGGPARGHYTTSLGNFVPTTLIVGGNTYVFYGNVDPHETTHGLNGYDFGFTIRWYLPK